MNGQQIPSFQVFPCPLGHKNLCPRKWKNRFMDHWIICCCSCHISNNVKGELK